MPRVFVGASSVPTASARHSRVSGPSPPPPSSSSSSSSPLASPGALDASCPVRAVLRWIDALRALGLTEGPLFRFIDRHGNVRPAHRRAASDRLSPQSVALIVQRRARAVGLDAAQFAGHSLRAGFVTSAVRAGKAIPKIMEQTGHRSANTVMAYVREADRWRDPASGGLGL